jgi:hypothetical protein
MTIRVHDGVWSLVDDTPRRPVNDPALIEATCMFDHTVSCTDPVGARRVDVIDVCKSCPTRKGGETT